MTRTSNSGLTATGALFPTTPQLLVVLGAGASCGYGPSTTWLTRRLLASGSGLEGGAVFRLIHQTLQRHLRFEGPLVDSLVIEPNFEEIIQVVDEIATQLPLEYGLVYGSSLLRPFLSLNLSLRALKPNRKKYSRYASRARQFILRETNRHCDGASRRRVHPLVSALAALSRRLRLRVMSINYDDLPAASKIDFYTGFVEKGGGAQLFRPVHPWPEDRHCWCQLHGSLLFRARVVNTELGKFPEIVRYRSRREVARRKWVDIDWGTFQDRHIAPVTPIVTALRKADAIQREPFAHYAHVFREGAFSCDRWLIIGYGGGDDHINSVLSQARRYWHESGRDHRVLVVGNALLPASGMGLFGAMEQRPESGLGREMWLFDEETYPMNARIRPREVAHINSALGVTLDGVDWAMGEGLPLVMKFLRI